MATYLLPLLNPSAENDLDSWEVTGSIDIGVSDPNPEINSGTKYWHVTSNFARMRQTVDVNPEVFSAIDNNSGFVGIQFIYGNTSTPRGSGFRVFVEALNSSNTVLGVPYDSGLLIGADEDMWYRVNTLITLNIVPPNTRKFRVVAEFGDSSSPSNGIFDDIYLFSSDGQFTTIRVSGVETNVLHSKQSDLVLRGAEAHVGVGEGSRDYEEAMRLAGVQTDVMYSREGQLNLRGAEAHVSMGEGGRIYEHAMRLSGLESVTMYSREGQLNLRGAEAHVALGKASDMILIGYEIHMMSSVRQKYTPIVTIFNETMEDEYQYSKRQLVIYEQPVRG